MALPPKPETSEEMLYQLWFCIIGSNGEGMSSRLKNVEANVKDIGTRFENHLTEKTTADKMTERRKMGFKEWLTITFTGMAGIAAIIAIFISLGAKP